MSAEERELIGFVCIGLFALTGSSLSEEYRTQLTEKLVAAGYDSGYLQMMIGSRP